MTNVKTNQEIEYNVVGLLETTYRVCTVLSIDSCFIITTVLPVLLRHFFNFFFSFQTGCKW